MSSAISHAKGQHHEDAVAVLLVRTKRSTFAEANASVERLGRDEGRLVSGLEEQLAVAAFARHAENVVQQCTPCPATTKPRRRSHRLHFALRRREFLESRAPKQHLVFPRGPEDDAWLPEPGRIEGKNKFRRRDLVHVP